MGAAIITIVLLLLLLSPPVALTRPKPMIDSNVVYSFPSQVFNDSNILHLLERLKIKRTFYCINVILISKYILHLMFKFYKQGMIELFIP